MLHMLAAANQDVDLLQLLRDVVAQPPAAQQRAQQPAPAPYSPTSAPYSPTA
jgi:hypothetical protein